MWENQRNIIATLLGLSLACVYLWAHLLKKGSVASASIRYIRLFGLVALPFLVLLITLASV
jgi:hypothetical protein